MATKDVADASTPAHMFTALADSTPRSGRNSGMMGATMLNAILMTNWTATIAHKVRRQVGNSAGSEAGVGSFMRRRI